MNAETPGAGKRTEETTVLAWMRLARVFQKMSRVAATEFARDGLSTAQFDVIAHLGVTEGMTQQELADRLLVTKGNVSQLLDKMEKRGLIARCPAGRANVLTLTPEGRRLFETVVPAHEARIVARFAALAPHERKQLLRLLRTLDHSLE